MKKIGLTLAFALCALGSLQAQELNCKVKVLAEKIQNVDPKVFKTLEGSISEFLNNRKWTNDQFDATEKIDCSILINVISVMKDQENVYQANMTVQSSRPVYNTGYNSTMINFSDKMLSFRYVEFQQLEFSDTRVVGTDILASNLTATLAYYAYLILGFDYDSYALNGGNDYFKRAQNIVNNAPENKAIEGWKANERGQRNRYWIVDNLFNSRFAEYHSAAYLYHRMGLDKMYDKPEDARKQILACIDKLSVVNKENPSSVLIQLFFTAKGDEVSKIISQCSREDKQKYIPLLSAMDVANAQRYQQLLK
jgi:hypothetical protein